MKERAGGSSMHPYVVWGLPLSSERPLPGLPDSGTIADPIPVTMRMGDIDAPPDNVKIAGPTIRVLGPSVWLSVPGVATCRVIDGREITVQVDLAMDADDALASLFGSLFALVLHQRGFLPLHASAVEVEGGAAAFVGRSCVGKSAVAAVLHGRGRRLIADDLVAVDTRTDPPVLWPGPPSLHLWPEVIDALGMNGTKAERVRSNLDKRTIPVRGVDGPLPIHHVTVIDAGGMDEQLDRRSGFDALSVLVSSSWHAAALEALQIRAAHFARCAMVARSAATWRWPRPQGVLRMGGSLAGLEAAWRAAREASQ